jgi:hypothetical protein
MPALLFAAKVLHILVMFLAKITLCLFGEGVEPAGPNVRLKMPVPRLGVELREPRVEGGKVIARKFAHRCFNLLDRAHAMTIEPLSFMVKRGDRLRGPITS